MKRTSTALRRLGVPVLAATLAIPASMLFSGTALAAAATMTRTPAGNPVATNTTVTEAVTGATAANVITFTITPANSAAFFTSGSGNGTKQTTCTADGTGACQVTLSDSVPETITVTATAPGDTFANSPDSITFASPNGTLSFTCPANGGAPAPCFGTASPPGGDPTTASPNGEAQQTLTYTPGSSSTSPGSAQTISLTVGGSAWFDPAKASNVGMTFGAGTKPQTATCTIPAGAGARSCTYNLADSKSEAVTVTASGVTPDVTTPGASGGDNFAGVGFSLCTGQQNTAAPVDAATNCATQQGAGSTVAYTLTYQEAGTAAANRAVTFTLLANGSTGYVIPVGQPSGTTATNSTTAQCTTNAQGQCVVNVASSAGATGSPILQGLTTNTAPYPASQAHLLITTVPNATPGRFVQTGLTPVRPAGQVDAVNEPGDVIDATFTLYNCAPNSTTGTNACLGQTALAGQSVSLSVDHGFFTNPCIHPATGAENYANCTFNTTPAAGTKVGDIKSLGTTTTATTNSSGNIVIGLGLAKDAALDQNGKLTATVTATVGSSTFTESIGPGNSASSTSCTAPSAGTPQAGCPSGENWTTIAQPLNGGTAKIVSIPNSSSETALSDSATTNVPDNQSRTVVVQLTDQFGNLTAGAAANTQTNLTLVKTGVGDLAHCTAWSSTDTCSASNPAAAFAPGTATPSTDSTGATKNTFTSVRGSYLSAFTSTGGSGNGSPQDRYLSTACPAPVAPDTKTCNPAQDGTQTLTATWKAPTTTFNTFSAATAATPAVATYLQGTTTVTDAVSINYFLQKAQAVVTFATTPSNTVPAGTVVTVSATVKDQFGNPIAGDNVQFVRSGPQTQNGTSCSATNSFNNPTNAKGQAGFSFTCINPSTQVVTIVVQDGSGNELARGTQTIHFTGTTPPAKRTVHATITCKSPRKHVLRCVVTETPHKAGLSVGFFRKSGSGPIKLGTARTNSNGVAVFRKKNIRSHVKWRVFARVAGSGTTKPATTGAATVTIK